jgi:membrane-bound inhibitor of C-type lysozyme
METILMMQRRFAFLAVAGAIVLASCGGAEQGDEGAVQEEAAAVENPHAGVPGAPGGMAGGMPGGHAGEISTAEGVENPHAAASSAMPGEGGVTEIMFKCAEDKAFMFSLLDGVARARITVDGESYELEHVESASGMKYSDGTWTFFGKGPEALVMNNEEHVLTECKAAGHP